MNTDIILGLICILTWILFIVVIFLNERKKIKKEFKNMSSQTFIEQIEQKVFNITEEGINEPKEETFIEGKKETTDVYGKFLQNTNEMPFHLIKPNAYTSDNFDAFVKFLMPINTINHKYKINSEGPFQ